VLRVNDMREIFEMRIVAGADAGYAQGEHGEYYRGGDPASGEFFVSYFLQTATSKRT
jgi:hypothetical protein